MPQYQGVWTLQQQMQALTSGQWATDPNFKNTTLLLQGDAGANGAQNNTFYDTSPNQFAITRNGNTTQGSFTPFSLQPGAWSVNTTSGSLTTPANAAFALSGDFTVECWVFSGDYSLDSTTRRRIFHTGGGDIASALQLVLGTGSGNSAVISVLNDTWLINGTLNVVTNSWVHIAVTRSGTSLRLFVNGVQSGSTATTSQNFNSGTSNTLYIGSNSGGGGLWQGYISNLRVVVGTAIYTSAFNPPTNPFVTNTTNQQLLVCTNNYFVDANTATTAKTVGVNATPSVQPFSPFAPQYQWTSDVIGGSGYFDGTGDYLTAADNVAFEPGTGDFTIEAWVYHTTAAGSLGVYIAHTSSGISFYRNAGGKLEFAQDAVGVLATSTNNVPVNAWTQVAVTRSGTTLKLIMNGAQEASVTNSTNLAGTGSLGIGASAAGTNPFTGYISGLRMLKGTGYSSISIPTAPPTAITNTSLLLNFTNAGIYDGTMKNNLETVGNAQVSTSVVKYGSGSMYFDGSGDSLVVKDTAAVTAIAAFRTGDFTVEMWVYPTANPATYGAIPNVFGTSDGWGIHYMPASAANPSTIRFDTFVSTNYAANNAVPLNQWTHIAVTRQGTALKFWVNGAQSGSTATVTESFNMTTATFSLGNSTTVSREFFGYIDDFRITKGVARYTQNFIPPSVALPRQ